MGQRHSRGVKAITDPTILTVVLNYRTPDLTLRAVAAALREMQGLSGQLTIVDNASGDGSFETLAAAADANGWTRDGRVRIIQSGRNGGFGAGNNTGIRAGLAAGARPDFIYILNSDAFPDAGAIHALLACLKDNPSAGLAGSYLHGPEGMPHVTAFRFPSISSEFEGAACTGIVSRLLSDSIVSLPIPKATQPVDWLAGASLMIRREVLDDIGLFDERFFLYFEETDLCRRAAKAGWQTLYVPGSSVTHIGSASTGMKTWQRTPAYWFESRMHYFVKNHGVVYAGLATLAHVAGIVIYRTRSLVSDKPRLDPPHFFRDLLRHAFRIAWRGKPRARPTPSIARFSPEHKRNPGG